MSTMTEPRVDLAPIKTTDHNLNLARAWSPEEMGLEPGPEKVNTYHVVMSKNFFVSYQIQLNSFPEPRPFYDSFDCFMSGKVIVGHCLDFISFHFAH